MSKDLSRFYLYYQLPPEEIGHLGWEEGDAQRMQKLDTVLHVLPKEQAVYIINQLVALSGMFGTDNPAMCLTFVNEFRVHLENHVKEATLIPPLVHALSEIYRRDEPDYLDIWKRDITR